jgi:hypothetical protein
MKNGSIQTEGKEKEKEKKR